MPPVQLTMQPLAQGDQPAVPLRWREAVHNLEAAQDTLADLTKQLEGALYLDDEAWQQAVPHAQFTAALQGQQRKIEALQLAVKRVAAALEDSEKRRRAAEQRVQELSAELENNASVFKLHYEELLRRDQEVHDLQAVISALSLGGSGGGAHGGGGSGSDSPLGSAAGTSDLM